MGARQGRAVWERFRDSPMPRALRASLMVTSLVGLLAAAVMLSVGVPAAAADDPHSGYGSTTDQCATCHRSHTAQGPKLSPISAPQQSALCFTCHDGTGATYNVAAEYNDPSVPANDPVTSSFYSHAATVASNHTSALDSSEFFFVLNRHSECGDCHDPHRVNGSVPVQTASGWTASGALDDISGVDNAGNWVDPISYEYEMCYKCHSGFTNLLSYTPESYKKTDKAVEFSLSNNSYHPIEGAGQNQTTEMNNSLAGGSRWQFSAGDTIRCLHCHGDYRLASPSENARLAPHTSQNRGLLIANYRDRDLKPRNEAAVTGDFALCFLCHTSAWFTDGSGNTRADTNFELHGYHTSKIDDEGGGGGLDIDTPGAGGGNALCAECHFRVHGTKLAPWSENQDYERGVNFAPNVEGEGGNGQPTWTRTADGGSCLLRCHGESHDPEQYPEREH